MFNKKTRKTLTDDIGNLYLTYNNSAYSNKPFPDKKGQTGQDKLCATRTRICSRNGDSLALKTAT